MKKLKKLLQEFRALKISLSLKFIIGVAIALIITLGVSLYFISKNHENLILKQVDLQARALFKQIVLTRRWIADHGGVFVEKVPWKDPNPYLKEPEIIDVKGRKYLKKSPAMVTKELSKYAKEKGLYWFHITSLNLVNPENAPDDFEKMALQKFEEKKIQEMTKIENIGHSYLYRYIAPLYIEQSCLKCHAHQGYTVGDVRGAISVTIPMDYVFSMIRSEKRWLILASIVTVSILMFVLYVMMKELVLRPITELKTSMEDFSIGDRRETSVIRTGDELEELCTSFADMSKSLSEYHTSLHDKVHTATKSLEEANMRLTELNEKKSDFIAKISHELRTPMTSIKGAMDYITTKFSKISETNKDTEDLMEFLNVIRNNADRLIRMVNDTLDLERIESGMFDLNFSHLDLLSLIKEVIISLQSIASHKKVTFQIASIPNIIIYADEDRMRQVLINLMSNAINYSPMDAEIHMSVSETGSSVTVSITDEGPGIPFEVQKKIFDKFYTIGKRHGTGLGLSICKGIIEAHKGKITVSSNEKGKGCTFSFYLPKAKELLS
jgi:signal transduction histidine kinase